jgi:phosphatidylserine/phosphatidylglycerophosphate/cardiolipin synthase-like enzyme
MPSQEQYSGSSSYRFVDKLINKGNDELLVVSPYLDNYYIKVLIRASRHRRVRIVTSSEALMYPHSMLKSLRYHRSKGSAKASAYFLALSAITLYLRFYYVALPIFALALVSLALTLRSVRSKSLQLKVITDRFVHEKLYISSDSAVTGSANLTYNGMHKNIEHVELTRDAREVAALRRHFEELWRRK